MGPCTIVSSTQPPQKRTPHSPTSTCRETTSAAFSLQRRNGAALSSDAAEIAEIRIRESARSNCIASSTTPTQYTCTGLTSSAARAARPPPTQP